MAESESIQAWDTYYKSLADAYLFPNEFVLRSFLGKYPNLEIDRNYRGKRICDISCGDGRNLTLLNKIGFELYATEVSQEICDITRTKLANHADAIDVDIRPGLNWSLPFEDSYFDYLLSWNALYYMRDAQADIGEHIAEYARILKSGGYMVACVPGPGCFSLNGAKDLGNDLIMINTDSRWNMLNGTIYHRFDGPKGIQDRFGAHFENFQFATIKDDCFGLPLEYVVFVCQRR